MSISFSSGIVSINILKGKFAQASDTFSRACNRAIFEAKNIGGKPSWKDLFEN